MNLESTYLIFAGLLLGLAWYQHVKKQHNTAILLLLLAGVIIRFYMASDGFLHTWDERFHALVAKNMIDHPFKPMLYKYPVVEVERTNWIANHIWLHKQPVPLWSMALSMKVFGVSEFAMRLPTLLLSTGGIWLTHDLGKRLFNKEVAFFAAFLFAIQGLVLELGAGRVATDHIDVYFMCFVLLAVWSAQRFSETNKIVFNVLCGIAVGLAILTKWLPALIVLPLWGLFQYQQVKLDLKRIIPRMLLLLLVVTLVALPWQLYIRSAFPVEYAYEQAFNMRHVTETLEGMGGPFYYHFDIMRMVYGEFVYIPVVWFIYQLIRNRKTTHLILFLWLVVPYLFFSFVQTKMQAYTLFSTPALLIICGLFWVQLKTWYRNNRYRWLVVLAMVGLIALPIRYSIERIKPLQPQSDTPTWVSDLKGANKIITNPAKTVVFNVKHYVEFMYYTEATAYGFIPSQYVIDSLHSEGFTVYLNQTPDLKTTLDGTLSIVLEEPAN